MDKRGFGLSVFLLICIIVVALSIVGVILYSFITFDKEDIENPISIIDPDGGSGDVPNINQSQNQQGSSTTTTGIGGGGGAGGGGGGGGGGGSNNNNPPPVLLDTDGDGILDDGAGDGLNWTNYTACTSGNTQSCDDNCLTVPNSNQEESDMDLVGNVCDFFPFANNNLSCYGDANGDGTVSSVDLSEISEGFGCNTPPCKGDVNGDGITNNIDQLIVIDVDNFNICPTDDADNDGLMNLDDNCDFVPNGPLIGTCSSGDSNLIGQECANNGECGFNGFCSLNQEDTDENGVGDVCQDTDDDSVSDIFDNCPTVANPNQEDMDDDGFGDVCDIDIDGDGTVNAIDNCDYNFNGPTKGSCTYGVDFGKPCSHDSECLNDACSSNQENSDADADGDACDLNTCGFNNLQNVGNGICEESENVILNAQNYCPPDCTNICEADPSASVECTNRCQDGVDNDHDGKIDWGFTNSSDLHCSSIFDDEETNNISLTHSNISWDDFPDFNLHENLVAVYGGLPIGDCYSGVYCDSFPQNHTAPLVKGFSHVDEERIGDDLAKSMIPLEKRAHMWAPFELSPGVPWNNKSLRSPWGNPMSQLETDWANIMADIANDFEDSQALPYPKLDLLLPDIERHWVSDDSIKNIQNDPVVPVELKQLSPDDFVLAYKRNMSYLYNHALTFPQTLGYENLVSSFADPPIPRTENIAPFSWDGWKTDFSNVFYLHLNFSALTNQEFLNQLGPFYHNQDYFASNAYYFRNYPKDYSFDEWNHKGQYLAYALFQIDVNREWVGNRPIYEFFWMRVSAGSSPDDDWHGIDSWMAHASAIFPFFSSNAGVWVWDWIGYNKFNPQYSFITDEMQAETRIAYENFIYGLYRLSKYNYMFEDNPIYYHPNNSRDLFVNKLPVYRGVVNDTAMLVAAHNPYAAPWNTTTFVISYPTNNQIGSIITTGQEVWLGFCQLDGSGCVSDDEDVDLSPAEAQWLPPQSMDSNDLSPQNQDETKMGLFDRFLNFFKFNTGAPLSEKTSFTGQVVDEGVVNDDLSIANEDEQASISGRVIDVGTGTGKARLIFSLLSLIIVVCVIFLVLVIVNKVLYLRKLNRLY